MYLDITLRNFRCFTDDNPARLSLKHGITALIGPNNAGKSAVLRFFYEARKLFEYMSSSATIAEALAQGARKANIDLTGVDDHDEIFSNFNDGDLRIEFRANELAEPPKDYVIPNAITLILSRETRQWSCELGLEDISDKQPSKQIAPPKSEFPHAKPQGNQIDLQDQYGKTVKVDLSAYFTLWNDLKNSMYVGPVRYITQPGGKNFDISIGHDIVAQWKRLKTEGNIRDRNLAHALETQFANMFQFKSFEILPAPSGGEFLVSIDKRSYYLRGLGSGLSQILALLINLVLVRPKFLFIEEPELNLHPNLQVEFVRALQARTINGVVYATHSIGLARETADFIYTLQKMPGQATRMELRTPQARLTELMGEMSFSALRELGFDKVLLVEGPTEVKVVRAFIEVLGKNPHKFLLVPLGGSSMINAARENELIELTRIIDDPKSVFAVIDSERTTQDASPNASHLEFQRVCSKNGIKCHILERCATENYLCDRAVKEVFGVNYTGLSPFQKRSSLKNCWPKSENWKIAQVMTKLELLETGLGKFIESIA